MGASMCCVHTDRLMLQLAYEEDRANGRGEAGLRSFVDEHRGQCGGLAGVGLLTQFMTGVGRG